MSYKIFVLYCIATWWHNPWDHDFELHHCENLKPHTKCTNSHLEVPSPN